MTTDLAAARDHRSVTPFTQQHAHQLVDIEPYAFLLPHLFAAPSVQPPGLAVLENMHRELSAAMLPCTKSEAAQAAGLIIAGYPQRDDTSAAYARLLVERLAACPADMLMKVVNTVIDTHPSFRPGAGDVKQIVSAQVGKRQRLLLQVEAAQRYWRNHHAEADRLAEVEQDKREAQARGGAMRLLTLPRLPGPAGGGEAKPERPKRTPPKTAHLSDAQLKATRKRL